MLTLALQTDSRGVAAVLVERPKVGAARLVGIATVERATSAEKLAEALRAALPNLRGGKAQLAVALGPDEVRVKRLAVPPAPEAELPPIVALQAARDAAADVDSIVVDFAPPQAVHEGPQSVLAAWVVEDRLAFWREVAEDLGGKLTVATPRPLAIAPPGDSAKSVLYLARAGESLDLVAIAAGEPVLLRSAQVGEAEAERELRRTLLALSAEGVATPEVLPLHEGLLADAPVSSWQEHFHVEHVEATGYDQSLAATGLALRTAAGAKPTINLADPRRPPVAQTNRRFQVLLVTAAASVILAGLWMAYERVAQLDRQIVAKEKEIRAEKEAAKAFQPYQSKVAVIDQWRQSDVNWLEELDRLGQKLRPAPLDAKDFPVASDIRATQLVATALLGGNEPGGRIDLTAVARSSSSRELESRLRDADHPVEPISTTESPAKDEYRYKYSALLRVPPDTEKAEDEAEAAEEKTESEEADDQQPEAKPVVDTPASGESDKEEPSKSDDKPAKQNDAGASKTEDGAEKPADDAPAAEEASS